MAFNEKIIEVQRLLEGVNALLFQQKAALDSAASSLDNYAKNAKLPSDFTNAQKQIKDQEKVRAELQKTMDAQNAAISKKKAEMQKMYLDMEAKRQKDLAAQEAKTAKEIALFEKTAQKEIEANNKRVQATEKRIAREIEIEEKRNARIITANEKLAQRQAAIDARNSRTGASSAIPGIGSKISDIREAEKLALANEHLNREYVKLNNSRTIAKNKLQDLIASEKASNAEIRKAQKEFDLLDAKVQKANRAVGQFSSANRGLSQVSQGVSNLMGAFGIATGLYLGASIVKNIYETTKQLQSMDLALKMVSGSQEEFASNQAFLTSLAEQYGIEIKGLTKNFTEFWVASKGKLEAEQIKAIFTSISKSVAVMGLSVEQQDSAFLALQQMMSKGTVQAEELKKQLGNALPGAVKAATMAYQALHPEMEVTEKFFMEQMKAGRVLSAELLPELAKAYERLYGIEAVTRAETLQAAQERLANSWTALVRSLNESETGGISKFFSIMLIGLDEMLKKIIRVNESWPDLFKKAKSEGAAQGSDTFNFIYGDLFKPLTSEQKTAIESKIAELNKIINSESQEGAAIARGEKNKLLSELYFSDPENVKKAIRDGARDRLTALMEQDKKVVEELNAFRKNAFKAAVTYGRSEGDAQAEKESLAKAIAEEGRIISLSYQKTVDNAKKAGTDLSKETEKQRKERLKKEKDFQALLEDLRKNEYARKLSDLERELEIIRDNFERKKNTGNDYVKFAFQMADKEQEITEAKYEEDMRLAKKNSKNKADLANLEMIALNNKYTAEENAYQKHLETLDKIKYDNKNGVTDTGPLADEETYGAGVFELDPKRAEDMVKAFQKVQEASKKTKEELQAAKDMLREFFQQTEGEFFSEAGFDKTYEMFFRLDEKGKSMFDNLMEAAKKTGQEFGVTFQAITETAQEAFNFLSQASNDNFENEYANLERRRDVALLFAGESEAARAEIERQYEERRRAIRIREWKAERQMALFNIAIDTAQAIVASVAKSPLTFGLPFSAIAAAIGLAQATIVSSQKMPQFWTGTDYAPEGPALTQERGREIILDKDGNLKSMGSDKGAQVTHLNEGDQVWNHSKTMDFLSFNKQLGSMLSNSGVSKSKASISMDTSILGAKIDNLSKTIAERPSLTIHDDERGRKIRERKQGQIKEYLNARITYKSYDI